MTDKSIAKICPVSWLLRLTACVGLWASQLPCLGLWFLIDRVLCICDTREIIKHHLLQVYNKFYVRVTYLSLIGLRIRTSLAQLLALSFSISEPLIIFPSVRLYIGYLTPSQGTWSVRTLNPFAYRDRNENGLVVLASYKTMLLDYSFLRLGCAGSYWSARKKNLTF